MLFIIIYLYRLKKLNDGDVQLNSMSSYYTNKLKLELLSAGEMFKYLKL